MPKNAIRSSNRQVRTGRSLLLRPLPSAVATLLMFMSGVSQGQQQAGGITPADSTTLERVEITTTARKRTEAAKDVPIAIESFSGKFLETSGITSPLELQFNVPNLTIQTYESGGLISLRGVGSGSAGLGYDPSSALHLDGVYLGNTSQALSRLFDVGNLEVIKGPQGTLYGRNATGGVVNIVSRAPSNELGGSLGFSVGSFSTNEIEGTVNIPLGPNTAFRFAAVGSNGGSGQILNVSTGNHIGNDAYSAARWRLKTQVGSLTADLTYQVVDDRANQSFALIADPRLPLPIAYNSVDVVDAYQGYRRTRNLIDPYVRKRDSVLGLTLSGEISPTVGWKSITGVTEYRGSINGDISSLGQTWFQRIDETSRGVSQEFQFNLATERADWVLGAYYYTQRGSEHREADIDEDFTNTVIVRSQDAQSAANGSAYALFADVNYRLSENWRMTAGLRINHETKDATVQDNGTGFYFPPSPLYKQEESFDDLSGRFGLDYRWNKDTLLYGSVSKGFKAGGITPFVNPGSGIMETYRPESLVAYEFGVKRSLPERRGQLNLNAFYYDYTNIQARIRDNASQSDAIRNAGAAKIYGAEAQFEMKIAGQLGIDLTAGWLDAKYDTFKTTDAQGNPFDFTGNSLPRAPRLTYSVAATLDKQALLGAQISGRLEYTYRDMMYFEPSNATRAGEENSYENSVGLVNVSLSYTRNRAPWTVTLAGRNLTDREYLDYSAVGFSVPGPARTWQIRYDYRF